MILNEIYIKNKIVIIFVGAICGVMLDIQEEMLYINRMQRGDAAAFEYFFKKYMKMLYAYALGFMNEKSVAEDVIQDVFVQFWHKREQIQYTTSVYSYLQRAVKNACINMRLHEDVERKYEQEVKYTEEEAFDWREAEELQKLRQRLFDAMDRLPERCREIFIMSCVDGLKYKEIAARMGITENTIKTQIKLGYKKLRDEMNLSDSELSVLLLLFFDFVLIF